MYQFQVLLDVSRHLVQLCTVEAYPAQVSHLNSLSCQSAILESGGVMSNEWWCESIIYIITFRSLREKSTPRTKGRTEEEDDMMIQWHV